MRQHAAVLACSQTLVQVSYFLSEREPCFNAVYELFDDSSQPLSAQILLVST